MDRYKEEFLISELRTKAINCQAILLDATEYYFYLLTVFIPKINEKYQKAFGKLEQDLRNLTKLITEIEIHIDFLYERNVKGKPLSDKALKFLLLNNKHKYRKNNFYYYNNKKQTKENYLKQREEIKSMYYHLVKLLHPDVTKHLALYDRFWHILVFAYKTYDNLIIANLYNSIGSNNNIFYKSEDNEKDYLLERIGILESRINQTRQKIKELFKQAPLIYLKQLNNPEWIKKRQKEILLKILYIKRKLKIRQTAFNII